MRLKVNNVCQVFDKDNLNSFVVGNLDKITVVDNKDGSFTINGTYSRTSASWYIIMEWDIEKDNISQIVEGHKYLLLGGPENVSNIHLGINIWYADGDRQSNYAGVITAIKNVKLDAVRVEFSFYEGATADNAISKPQLFDLTEMYGAGNEPTTVAQFRQDFPNEMYEYSPVCWKKFRRLKYVNAENNYLTLNRGKYITNKEPVQLLDKNKYRATTTLEGITFTNNGDGTWTVVGTAPDDPINHSYVAYSILHLSKEFTQKYFIPGHKISVGGGKVNYDAFVQWILSWTGGYIASNSSANYPYTITEYPENFGANYIELRVNKGKTVNFTFKPQFFDLTAMYGKGNEPTTVAQFRADYPNELYDYNPYNAITFR